MPVKIQIQRRLIARIAHQTLKHPNHFRAFFIDGGGVEIVDLDKAFRPHGMRQRPRILAKLAGAQGQHIFDALDGGRPHIAGKLLVAKDRQPLFQAQLKPIAAGDAVACPIVEIFVRYDGFNPAIIVVGRRLRAGQHEFGVEDVQPLILHCPHVEIVNCHDIEDVQIVLAPIDLLIPAHRADQTVHRIGAAVFVTGADIDVQINLAAAHRGETVAKGQKIACHQREQIGGLGPRVVPFGPTCALRYRIAV